MSVENCRYGKARGKRQEARVKRVWAILHFFTQFGFIVFTYLSLIDSIRRLTIDKLELLGEALLDFSSVTDLEQWLQNNPDA